MRNAITITVVTIALLAAGGCGVTVTESFAGKDPKIVWAAMEAVARTPVYEDPDPLWSWEIAENEVYIEPGTRRMEVFRRLVHVERRPYEEARRRESTWRLQIELVAGPVASFKARGWEIPAHVWNEGARYFDDVWEILGGRPEPEPEPEPEHEPGHDVDQDHDAGADGEDAASIRDGADDDG
ncbi:MAG: hypothetical protein ACYTGR_16200 [Planctomycetota bacterium]|jgi:hypothetical protein